LLGGNRRSGGLQGRGRARSTAGSPCPEWRGRESGKKKRRDVWYLGSKGGKRKKTGGGAGGKEKKKCWLSVFCLSFGHKRGKKERKIKGGKQRESVPFFFPCARRRKKGSLRWERSGLAP